jgi:hypothetical protein
MNSYKNTLFQHTPVDNRLGKIHDLLAKLDKLRADQRLRHVVSNHHIGWTILDFNLTTLDKICDVEILDVEVSRTLS